MGIFRIVLFTVMLALQAVCTASGWAQDSSASTAPTETPAQTPVTFETLSLQIAQLRKLAADETFLAAGVVTDQNASLLTQKYELARSEIPCAPAEGEPAQQAAVRKMLCADIEYRLFLIRSRVGFWGGVRTLLPEIPPVHLRQLRTLLGEFEKLAAEIDVAQTRNEVAENELLKSLANQVEAIGQTRANSARREASLISQDAAQLRKTQFDARLGAIINERATLQREEAGALAQRQAAQAALSGALVKAASAAVGAPDWVADVAQGKAPDKVLRQTALQYVGDKIASDDAFKGQLDGALGKLGTSTDELVKAYNDVRSLKQQVDTYGKDLNRVGAVLRQPTLDGLIEVGTIAWQAMPPDEKGKWRAKISDSRPILEALSLMDRPDSIGSRLKQRAADYLASQPGFSAFLKDSVASYLDTRIDEASGLYGEILKRVSGLQLTDEQARVALDSVARVASSWLLNQLDEGSRAALRDDLGVTTDIQLENRLASEGLKKLPRVRVLNGRIEISAGNGQPAFHSIDVIALLRAPSAKQVAIATDTAKSEILRLVSEIGTQEDQLRQTILDLLPFEQIDAGVRRIVAPSGQAVASKAEAAWRQIVADDPNDQAQATDLVAASQLGAAYAQQVSSQSAATARDTLTDLGLPSQGAPPQPLGGPEQQVLTLALDAAFPGAGTGYKLVSSVVEGLSAVDSANKHLDLVRSQLKENFASEARLLDLSQEAETNAKLAEQEGKAYEALQDAYQQVSQINSFAVSEITRSTERNQARIQIRRSLTFYLTERLREEFDLLDRSIGLWAGIDASPRGTIMSLIEQDPQNIRLALDSEIGLFSFFDRSTEGMRTDVDRLLLHWRQLVRIAEDACVRIGCESGTAAAQVRDTGLLSLCQLLPDSEVNALQKWLERPDGRLSLRFFLSPQDLGIPLGQRNHRIVRIRLGAIATSGSSSGAFCSAGRLSPTQDVRFVALHQATLTHPGVAFVPRGDGLYDREGLLVRRIGSFELPNPFDTEALARRWIDTDIPERDFIEGYSPFTEWELDLDPDPSLLAISDIVLRIAYQYNDPINIVTESSFVAANQQISVDPFTYEVTWDQRDGVAEAGSQPRTLLRVPQHGTLSIDMQSMALLSSVKQLVDTQRRQGSSAVPKLELGQLSGAHFRLIRRCKAKSDIVDELGAAVSLAAGAYQNPSEPWDLRKRELAIERYRQAARLDREADELLKQDYCQSPLVIVGPPL